NMKVQIWGNVQFPGLYLLSEKTTVIEVISLAGGPQPSADLDDMRVFRMKPDSTYEMINFNYNDLLWNDKLEKVTPAPKLLPGDIILLPGEPRLYWREYLSLGLSVMSTLLSITLSIIYITN
ncbi:MAG: SLBB domain-containing protein, partial [Ignavibacteriaceae bacterium]|nr:SLBB domain-containing protein [Ignavibacteriaceae bacterium]